MKKTIDQMPKLPKRIIYIFPSIGISILLYFNLYIYRINESIITEYVSHAAFLVLFGVFFSNGFGNVLLRRDLKKIVDGSVDFSRNFKKHSTAAIGIESW